jgi:hypothetical protein
MDLRIRRLRRDRRLNEGSLQSEEHIPIIDGETGREKAPEKKRRAIDNISVDVIDSEIMLRMDRENAQALIDLLQDMIDPSELGPGEVVIPGRLPGVWNAWSILICIGADASWRPSPLSEGLTSDE